MIRASAPRTARAAVLFILVAVGAVSAAFAGSLQVDPVRIDLSAAEKTAAITLRNAGAEPIVVQIDALAWAQELGNDVYTPTSGLLVTPPIVTIPASGEQLVRTALRGAPEASRETAFRIYFQEVPPPPKPGFRGLQVALRIGIPVFVQPAAGNAAPRPQWRAVRTDAGQVHVSVANDGNGHLKVSALQLFAPGAERALASEELAYVLPGQRREWLIPVADGAAPARVRLKASTNAGDLDTELPVGAP